MMLEHIDHLAETAATAISNIKFDKVTVWDSGDGRSGASGFLRNMGGSIPPLMDIMRNIGGVELPDYFGKMNLPESEATEGEAVESESESEPETGSPGSEAAGGNGKS